MFLLKVLPPAVQRDDSLEYLHDKTYIVKTTHKLKEMLWTILLPVLMGELFYCDWMAQGLWIMAFLALLLTVRTSS